MESMALEQKEMGAHGPITLELCGRTAGRSLTASAISGICSLQRGWRATRSTASAETGFLVTEFAEAEVRAIFDEGGTFFLVREGESVLGFALTTDIHEFTEQLTAAGQAQLLTSETIDLKDYTYLYQIVIGRGLHQRGLGRMLMNWVHQHTAMPILADVLSSPVPNTPSIVFFTKLGYRKIGELRLDNYRDFGALTSEVFINSR